MQLQQADGSFIELPSEAIKKIWFCLEKGTITIFLIKEDGVSHCEAPLSRNNYDALDDPITEYLMTGGQKC